MQLLLFSLMGYEAILQQILPANTLHMLSINLFFFFYMYRMYLLVISLTVEKNKLGHDYYLDK